MVAADMRLRIAHALTTSEAALPSLRPVLSPRPHARATPVDKIRIVRVGAGTDRDPLCPCGSAHVEITSLSLADRALALLVRLIPVTVIEVTTVVRRVDRK